MPQASGSQSRDTLSATSPLQTEVTPTGTSPPQRAKILVAGVLAVDISMIPTTASPLRTTAPGKVALSLGGVAGNVAGAAHSLLASSSPDGQDDVLLLAAVARDTLGEVARNGLDRRNMRTDGLSVPESSRTATCGILLDESHELVGGVADMDIADQLDGAEVRSPHPLARAHAVSSFSERPARSRGNDLANCRSLAGLKLCNLSWSASTATCRRMRCGGS